jgi:DNA-binding beta-propeller fold protein YncE
MMVAMRILLFCAFSSLLLGQKLVVLNKEDATLILVDPKTGAISGKTPTGEGPHEVDVSADGRLAFVTNYGSGPKPGNSLSVIDLTAAKEHRVDLTPMMRPHGIAVSGGKVWFTAEGSKLVGRFDPATNKVDALLGTGQNSTHMVMLTADGKTLVTANIAGDSVSVFTLDGANWNQTVVPVGKGPEGMDFAPGGKELWAAHSRDGGVSIVDLASKKVIATFDAGTKRSNRIKLTEDGKLALISDLAGNELVIVDTASRKVAKRMQIGKSPEGILIEPGGARAYIAVTGQNEIAVLDLKSLEVTKRIKTGNGPDGMAWVK